MNKHDAIADARLIAAAPELLEALRSALRDMESTAGLMACDNDDGKHLFCLRHNSISEVRTAIFNATGGDK
jgi:hypothetical protein